MVSERLIKLVDHIEMDHEREVAPGADEVAIARMHVDMHANRDDWDHIHTRDGEVIDR